MIAKVLHLLFVLSNSSAVALAAPGAGKILLIGDSHTVRGIGDGIRISLLGSSASREQGFYQFSVSGSQAEHWLAGDFTQLKINAALKVPGKEKEVVDGEVGKSFTSTAALLERLSPDTVVVMLGTNDSAAYHRDLNSVRRISRRKAVQVQAELMERAIGPIRKLATLAAGGGRKCVWILPPRMHSPILPSRDHQKFVAALKKTVHAARCKVLDPTQVRLRSEAAPAETWKACLNWRGAPLTANMSDGIHYQRDRGTALGRCLGLGVLEVTR